MYECTTICTALASKASFYRQANVEINDLMWFTVLVLLTIM